MKLVCRALYKCILLYTLRFGNMAAPDRAVRHLDEIHSVVSFNVQTLQHVKRAQEVFDELSNAKVVLLQGTRRPQKTMISIAKLEVYVQSREWADITLGHGAMMQVRVAQTPLVEL